MFRLSLVCLSFLLAILSISMANPCPCELIVNESIPNNAPTSTTDSINNPLADIDTLDDYLNQLTEQSHPEIFADASSLYPLLRQTKSLDVNGQRLKRPSWAAVGKRAAAFRNKRPSWAQVG
ncbi:unnamed protein product [Adineta ricciae]|uniref:Uncharacterized protein n=1 Tax=Adineta ricciae TaxID=249248 RepID=A0A813XZW5_ADIRI|nr:unnamed protein product [Adineta ricciae]